MYSQSCECENCEPRLYKNGVYIGKDIMLGDEGLLKKKDVLSLVAALYEKANFESARKKKL